MGEHFANREITFTHIYSSDLSRAYKTAESLKAAQKCTTAADVLQVPDLREQDFGFYEGKPFYARSSGSVKSGKDVHRADHKAEENFKDVETKESMAKRANKFLDEILLPILHNKTTIPGCVVAVVSHGIMLSNLWRCLLRRQPPNSVIINPELLVAGRPLILEHLGGWGNTGFLELFYEWRTSTIMTPKASGSHLVDDKTQSGSEDVNSILDKLPEGQDHDQNPVGVLPSGVDRDHGESGTDPTSSARRDIVAVDTRIALTAPTSCILSVQTINGKEHLRGLKRTGGGVGSSKFDAGQPSIETFFKRQKK